MSNNWLGFSLTPHLRIDEGFGTTGGVDGEGDHLDDNHQNQPTTYNSISSSSSVTAPPHHHHQHHHQNIPVMPLRSDGSLCILDPFRHPSDWRYESNMDVGGGNASEEGPKLEDFLGSCYSSSPSDHHAHNSNGINVNVDLVSDMEAGGEDLGINTSSFIHASNNSNNYQYFLENNNTNPNPNQLMMMSHQDHHVGFDDSATSSSVSAAAAGFKSWLSQAAAPFCDMKSGSNHQEHHPHHQVTNFQSLSLSMSSPTNNSNQDRALMVLPPPPPPTTMISPLQQVVADNCKKRGGAKSLGRDPAAPRKSIDTFGQRTSQFRGVTRHRWTGRYEAHLWDNSCRKEGQTRKGRQVYLGGYDKEEKAARAYDLAALKYWGPTTHINFPLSSYEPELEEMKEMTRQEFVANLRRKSSGFSRGASVYRGVTRHHQHGRWQARIGRVAGNKDLYLGTFSTQEEAAEAYDIAAIKFRGTSAVTNFGISRYDVKRICSSSTLIASDLAKRSSSRDGAPLALEDCASSKSPTMLPVLAITNGKASDELTGMMWSDKGSEHDQLQPSFGDNDGTLVGSSSRNSSSSESLKCLGGGDLPPHQGYYSFQGPKTYEV